LEIGAVLSWAVFASFLSLLIAGALTDLSERRIPNCVTAAVVLLYPLHVLASPAPVPWLPALGVAALVFAIGFTVFACGWIGGGDVKLIAAVSLWAGQEHIVLFMIATSLAGGVLALAALSWQRLLLGPLGLHLEALGLFGGRPAGGGGEPAAPATLPYGVAIAAGGILVALQLMKH
jgi:prepilin peptidase CpaA